MTGGLHVTGGAGGITARYEDMDAVSRILRATGADLLDLAGGCHRWLADLDVAVSAILDPAGAKRFEGAMLAALDGPRGLTAAACAIELGGIRLAAAVVAYRAQDALLADMMDLRRYAQVAMDVATFPIWAVGPATVGIGAATFGSGGSGRDAGAEAERLLTEHPGIVDEMVDHGPGVLAALTRLPVPKKLEQVCGGIGLFYPGGHPKVEDQPADLNPAAIRVPSGVADLLAALQRRNSQAAGQIDVRTVTYVGPDGSVHRSHIVDIPGTKEWNLPGHSDSVNDFGTNVRGLAGEQTTYEKGVAEALDRAGVRPDEPLLLVGHSQGGIVALHAANSFATSGRYLVTAVVTAGSPVGRLTVPNSVQVLSLENANDIVPHLDGQPNPDQANRTTVTFHHQTGSIGANHAIDESYFESGQQVDSSTAASIAAWRRSVEDTFLFRPGALAAVEAKVYQLSRVP